MTDARHRADAPPRTERWLRRFRLHLRLVLATAVGVIVAMAMPGHPGVTLRAVIGWDVGVSIFLALVLVMMVQATPESMRWRARLEDEARWVFLTIMAWPERHSSG